MNKKSDAKGIIINCPNYEMCPVCYKCRNYSTRMQRCVENCSSDYCDTKKHRSDLISKLIIRPEINLMQEENDTRKL